jgi:hypothetical protein
VMQILEDVNVERGHESSKVVRDDGPSQPARPSPS